MNDKILGLKPGSYYWARVRPSEFLPESEWQPVRYTGRSMGMEGTTWDFIGLRSEDGHHFASVIQVGPEIVCEPLEPDDDLRKRLQEIYMREEHQAFAAVASGRELDTLAGFYGLTRRGLA